MQEVTIKARSAFKHFVYVDKPNKEICWNFCTRKKNISFGLFRKLSPADRENSNEVDAGTSGGVGTTFLNSGVDTHGSSGLPRNRSDAAIDKAFGNIPTPNGSIRGDTASISSKNANGDSTDSATIATTPSTSKKRTKSLTDPELVEVLPIAHYDSSKLTIKGSYLVKEPGTYVLLFDNTFSVNTSKKLFFFVALKDVEPTLDAPKKEVEGWILKKGNRRMQGYLKRWLRIDPEGTLTYYKHPGSRGSAHLPKSAVHLQHDHLLIDIDSGQNLFHFKAVNRQDFQMWIAAIEKYATPKSMQVDMSDGTPEDATTATRDKRNSKIMLNNPDLDELEKDLGNMVANLTKELNNMSVLIDSSKGRIDSKSSWKDFTLILGSLSDVCSHLVTNASQVQRRLTAYNHSMLVNKERIQNIALQAETALQACLMDNNRIRTRFGLDPVTLIDFVPAGSITTKGAQQASTLSIATSIGALGEHGRSHSMASGSAREDVFYDAEEGTESEDMSDSEDEMAEAEEDRVEDSDYNYDSEDAGTTTPPSPVQTFQGSSLKQEITASVQATDGSEPQKEEPPPKPKAVVVRRKALGGPLVSMENISIMSILRNNVGKDLSTVAMPIALNEPLNLLQKLCEELEYSELLDAAAGTPDPVDRMVLVTAFAISAYSSTVNRAGRKPFNPLLGETYEAVRDDKGFRFVSEKVSHHPPIMACHAESKNYIFYQDSYIKTKFWGKSMELIPSGT
ncbi:Oxysterol-binding protein- protein 3, partial [Quaeritorhiza haematococci]